jgi:hypothetical protein
MAGGVLARSWVSLVFGAALAPCAHACLGGGAASVEGETSALNAVLATRQAPQYEILEITAPSGVDIREYLNQHGTIFALSWKGPVPPDLQRLLGSYFAPYSAALAALDHPGLRRSLRIAAPSVIVESSGHLRAYRGLAYLPAEMPSGVPLMNLR